MESSKDLEKLTRQLYESMSRSDSTFVEQHMSGKNCVSIGTAPDEWWNDSRSAGEALREQMKAAGNTLRLVAGDIKAYQHGEVGWVADQLQLFVGENEVPCRHTAVYIREGGEWRIVQNHFSIGVPNEDVFPEWAEKLKKAG